MKNCEQIMLLLLLQILLYNRVINGTPDEWIDPYKLESLQPKQEISLPVNDGMIYYKRTINLLLASVIKESSDPNVFKGRLFIDIPIDDYKFLKKFATMQVEEPLTLQKVDQILTKVLTKSTIDEISDMVIYWSDYIYFAIFNRATGVYLIVFCVLIVVYKLLKASYTPYQVIKYLIFLGYLVDFSFTWKRLLQELEINKYADSLKHNKMPADCKLVEMSGWQFLLSFVSGANNCREYHKNVLYDVFYDVGPLDVIAHQTRVLARVASNIGIALSKLTTGLMSDLPFPLNVMLLPALLLFLLFLVWSILTYLTETQIDLNLFHVVSIKFKTNKRIKDVPEEKEIKYIKRELEEIEPAKREETNNIANRRKTEKRKSKESQKKEVAKESAKVGKDSQKKEIVKQSPKVGEEVVENIPVS